MFGKIIDEITEREKKTFIKLFEKHIDMVMLEKEILKRSGIDVEEIFQKQRRISEATYRSMKDDVLEYIVEQRVKRSGRKKG